MRIVDGLNSDCNADQVRCQVKVITHMDELNSDCNGGRVRCHAEVKIQVRIVDGLDSGGQAHYRAHLTKFKSGLWVILIPG